jgi:hypothetical protein
MNARPQGHYAPLGLAKKTQGNRYLFRWTAAGASVRIQDPGWTGSPVEKFDHPSEATKALLLIAAIHGLRARCLVAEAAKLDAQPLDLTAIEATARQCAVLYQCDIISRQAALEAGDQRPSVGARDACQRSIALGTEYRDQVYSFMSPVARRWEQVFTVGHRIPPSVQVRRWESGLNDCRLWPLFPLNALNAAKRIRFPPRPHESA